MEEGKNWEAIGKATLSQLPKKDKDAFIEWLNRNEKARGAYEKCPMDAVVMWQDSRNEKSRMDYRELGVPLQPVWRPYGYDILTNGAIVRDMRGLTVPPPNAAQPAVPPDAEVVNDRARVQTLGFRPQPVQYTRSQMDLYAQIMRESRIWIDNPTQAVTLTGIGTNTITTGTDNNG